MIKDTSQLDYYAINVMKTNNYKELFTFLLYNLVLAIKTQIKLMIQRPNQTYKATNPEDRFSSPAEAEKLQKSQGLNISLDLLQTIQNHLFLKNYKQAKEAAKNNSFLLKSVNYQLLSEDISQLIENQPRYFDKTFQLGDKQEKLFRSIKKMKQQKSPNMILVRTISQAIKQITYFNDTGLLDDCIKQKGHVSDLIFKPLKELWLKISKPTPQSQLQKILKQNYQECKLFAAKISSLERQLELYKSQLRLKTDQLVRFKQKQKKFLYNQIKVNQIYKEYICLQQEWEKYMDKLQQVYTNSAQHQKKVDQISEKANSPINKLVTKMQQSIKFHRDTYNAILVNHQREIEELKRDYESEIEKVTANLQLRFKEQIEKQVQKFKEQSQQLYSSVQSNIQKIKQLQTSNRQLQQKTKEYSTIKTKIQTKIIQQTKQLKDTVQSLERRLKNKDQEITAQRQFSETLKINLEEKELLIQLSKEMQRTKEEEINNLEQKLKAAKLRCQEFETRIEQSTINKQEQHQQKNTEKQTQENSKLQENIEQLQKIREQRDKLEIKLLELTALRNKEIQEFQKLTNKMQQVTSKNSSLQKMLEFQKTKLEQSEQKYNFAQFKKVHPQDNVEGFFVNQILDSEPEYKLFLKKTLEQRYKSKIFKTNLVYKLDQLNKINFHQYIDHKENLLAIVKLVNGNIVAAYSQGKVYPKMVADKDGLLISVTNREVFQPAQNNKRAVFFDDYFFILGNSQFRVKSGQLKFFSNFGVANGYYKARGHKVNTITGTNERQMAMVNLQFYQIVYL